MKRLRIMVVAAHPDDEVLGCGGVMARHSRRGDEVHVLILAEGVTSRDEGREVAGRAREIEGLRRAAIRAAGILGVAEPVFGGMPDNRMDALNLLDIVKFIERHVVRVQPHRVLTHFAGDLNVDHRLTAQAVLTACRPEPGSTVRSICAFEIPSSTDWGEPVAPAPFQPNLYVDVQPFRESKMQALECYASEMRSSPHPRSGEHIQRMMRWRGAAAGLEAAEAFMILREIRGGPE